MFKRIKHTLVAAGLLAAAAFAQAGIAAPPAGTYDFSGTCLDCDDGGGSTPASATLIIGNSSDPGTWSFSYQSLLYNLASTFVELASLGAIDGEGNADSFIYFGADNSVWEFRSDLGGSWSLDNVDIIETINEDFGRNGVWALRVGELPEPASLALVALGLLAATQRRRAAS